MVLSICYSFITLTGKKMFRVYVEYAELVTPLRGDNGVSDCVKISNGRKINWSSIQTTQSNMMAAWIIDRELYHSLKSCQMVALENISELRQLAFQSFSYLLLKCFFQSLK